MQILEKINKFGIVYVIDFCYKAAMSDSSPSKAPRVGAVPSVGRSAGARRGRVGFSLIEVAISLGVVSFAFVSILSLVPLGMTTFHSAMDISVGTQISQRVVNDLQQTDFGTLINSTQPVRYFDEQGQEVPSATGAVYQVNTQVADSLALPGAATANSNIANVIIQIARNSGGITLAKDASNLWISTAGVRLTTYSTVISGCN